MAKRRELTVVGFMIMPDGTEKPMEELTPEELDDWDRRRVHRTSRVMSEIFTLIHPEAMEYIDELEAEPEKVKPFYERFPELKQKNRRNNATAIT